MSATWIDTVKHWLWTVPYSGTSAELALINGVTTWLLVFGALSFLLLTVFKFTAPYGRFTSTAWGPPLPAKFAWIVQESPVLVFAVISAYYANYQTFLLPQRILFALVFIHYTHRTLIFPLRITGGKPSPFLPFIFAFFYCSCNGYIQARFLTYFDHRPTEAAYEPLFILGVVLFFSGMVINMHSDYTLISLRKPGETGYKIPRGGMFEFVSGANFFGEILEWTGFALAAWNYPALQFALFTASNIGPRALHHHAWYLTKFEDYPKQRKALIPFLI